MARPLKDEGEKRNKRLMIYLTPFENERLYSLSEILDKPKTKIVSSALEQYVNSLKQPPKEIVRAKKEQIEKTDKEHVIGFICSRGHAFWIEKDWNENPKFCPVCGDEDIKQIWSGVVKKIY